MGDTSRTVDPARTRLGRIRCLVQAVESMKSGDPLPGPLCFVPERWKVECDTEEVVDVVESPQADAKSVGKLQKGKHTLEFKGRPLFTEEGGWGQLTRPHENSWIMLQPSKTVVKVLGCIQVQVENISSVLMQLGSLMHVS